MRPSLLVSLFLVVACGSKQEPTPVEADGDTDADTDGDTDADTDADGDTDTDLVVDPPPELTATIVELPPDVFETGQSRTLRGQITGHGSALVSSWSSALQGPLGPCEPDPDGFCALDTTQLTAGEHVITLSAEQGGVEATDTEVVYVCAYPPVETFDTSASIQNWTIYGDSAWDPGGWLEITGNVQSRAGSIYKTDERVNAGNFAVSFSIATGGGINTGADGFAVNVWNVPDVQTLDSIVAAAGDGGCLGYGVTNGCNTLGATSFHIEFDTWQNINDPVTDPTPLNHVGIMTDGDATTHHLWAPVPSLEDLAWRDVRVEVIGSTVTVEMAGQQIISGEIPGFQFEGGYLGVSGSTGWATNYHRFDNLFFEECVVPEAP